MHANLFTSEYMGEVFIKGTLFTNGLYPALIEGEDTIHAEAYKINQYTLQRLDELESKGYLYERRQVSIGLSDGTEDKA